MNNKRIIKATLIAALSISFLFNEPSFASSEEEKPLEANNQGLFEENEATVEKKEEAKKEEASDKESEQNKEDANKDKAPALETSLKEDKSVEKEGKATEVTHKADLNKDSSTEEKKDDIAVEKKDEGRLIYIAEFKDKEAGERAMKEISKLSSTKVLYAYNTIFNGCAIETKQDNLDLIKHIEGISSVERSQKVEPMMNHAREEIGVNEAIDYLKAINKDMIMKFDGRGMVIANIDTGTDYRHKAMRIDDDAKPFMRYKKEDLQGTD
ncbi:MAG: serine protease, partial [Anaerococcus sp.]|nr:serine protease [Anaerococcus sp.]